MSNLKYISVVEGFPVFELIEPSREEWSRKAKEANRRLFSKLFGMDAESDQEAEYWINKYFKGE